MEELLLNWLQEHWYDLLTSVLALGFFAKYVALRKAAGEFFDLIHSIVGAKKNGQITDAEYTVIGKKAVPFADTLWGVIKGLLPNKSKVV